MRRVGAGEAPVRRTSAVAAVLLLTIIGSVLLAAGQRAAASQTRVGQAQSQVTVMITGLSRQWAAPGQTITVRGTLTNNSKQQITSPVVQLESSGTVISGIDDLVPYTSGDLVAVSPVSGASWRDRGNLAARSSVGWSARLPVDEIGMTTFGVYQLTAEAGNVYYPDLASASTFLPYMPARHGTYSYSIPRPEKVAWVWPLIGEPILDEPWQLPRDVCTGSQARQLAASMTGSGRLAELLSAGMSGHGSTLASRDSITWAIDPALLANAAALADCPSGPYRAAAKAWLSRLSAATSGQPVFVTPYADLDLTSLISQGQAEDVREAFDLGRTVAGQILHRNMDPSASGGQITGIAWPADGIQGQATLESLAAKDGVGTVLVGSQAMPQTDATVVRTLDGEGSYDTVLLANDDLTDLLGSASNAPGSAFATSQLFLAETAEMAAASPSGSVVVAPPQRWRPPAGLAASLLSATASAPWLKPTSLSSLAAAKKAPLAQSAPALGGQATFSTRVLHQLRRLDQQIQRIQNLQAVPDADLYLAVAAIESSAWNQSPGRAASLYKAAEKYVSAQLGTAQQGNVEIVADSRNTLGGLKGPVPVSIYNRLDYAVQVRLRVQTSQASGGTVTVTESPSGLITIPAHHQVPIKLHLQASQTGPVAITMWLVNRTGQPLASAPVRVTVRATQFGTLAVIIIAVALGIFLIASAARAVRRGRPAPADDAAGGATVGGEADNVMSEDPALGAAGKSGLR